MRPPVWVIATAAYCALLAAAFVGLWVWLSLDLDRPPKGPEIVSAWRDGKRVARRVTTGSSAAAVAELGSENVTVVVERVVDDGPVVTLHPSLLALSFVAGRDGVWVSFRGRDAYLTPDDLLSHGLYDPGSTAPNRALRRGIDVPGALRLLARDLGCSPDELAAEGRLRRFVVEREVRSPSPAPATKRSARPTVEELERAARAAARFLAGNLGKDGLFRYELKATTGEVIPGYNWPRHGGATLFLAEAAVYFDDRRLLQAARRAARRLRDATTLRCGKHACIGEGDQVDVGSAALAALGYAVLASRDKSFRKPLAELSAFLRSQQRADGEFMHVYDRARGQPVDVQLPFYSGEAVLALARAHRITKNPADLEAARRGLRYLTSERWSFFGSRYYFDAEHWTCQALEELWARAPDPDALAFCMRWNAYNRWFQQRPSPIGDYDGGFTTSPFFPPRLTPAGSRTEGAAATLATAALAAKAAPGSVSDEEIAELEDQVARALAFVIRHELPGSRGYLLADPKAMRGAFPGSPVDLTLRIDFQQHVGSAMLRYATYLKSASAARVAP